MIMEHSFYNVREINDFLKIVDFKEECLFNYWRDSSDNLRCLKLALEIYSLRRRYGHRPEGLFKKILDSCNSENVNTICDILIIGNQIQTAEELKANLEHVNHLYSEHKLELMIYLKLVNAFIKTDIVLDTLFIITIYRNVLVSNSNMKKNYFITDILKPYLNKSLKTNFQIFEEIVSSKDLYTVSCLSFHLPIEGIPENFWLYILDIFTNGNDNWEYKLALDILKTSIKSVNNENFGIISNILKGDTQTLSSFHNTWNLFFILIETSEEKQLHLVEPSLILLKGIQKLYFLWINCIYNKLLNHMQSSVVYKTSIVILNDNLNLNIERLELLFTSIKRNDCSDFAIDFFETLKVYVSTLDSRECENFLRVSSKINWTPLSAWMFYNHCEMIFSKVSLSCIRDVLKNLKTLPHKYIRDGCLYLFKKYQLSSNDFSNNEIENLDKNYSLEEIVDCLLNYKPDALIAYKTYNKFYINDKIYAKEILDFWTRRILTGKVSPDICSTYITHLSVCFNNNSYRMNLREIEEILQKIFSTQHEGNYQVIYENLSLFLKQKQTNIEANDEFDYEKVLFLCYQPLINMKQKEIREVCISFYWKTFYEYCQDYSSEKILSILDDVGDDEIMAFFWIVNLPEKRYNSLLPYVLKLIYFGESYTKHKKYEDAVCYQVFEKYEDDQKIEPTREAKIRLQALMICTKCHSDFKIWETLTDIPTKRYFPDSSDHILCLRSMQTILILIQDDNVCKVDLFEKILCLLCEENHQPSVRQLIQWILIKLSFNRPEYVEKLLTKFGECTSVSALTSLILVLYYVSKKYSERFLDRTVGAMLPYTTGAIFKLRVYSQVAVFKLITTRKDDIKYRLIHKLLEKTISDNFESVKKVLQTDWELFEHFDPEVHYNLFTILVDIPKLNNVVEGEWRYIEWNLTSSTDYITNILPNDNIRMNIPSKPIQKKSSDLNDFHQLHFNIQKKIVPSKQSNSINKQCNLIVIASLITSSANLGGLARTCEIYGVKKLVVNDEKIVNDKEFKSLSMSSEYWLNINEVKKDGLIEYIEKKKRNGYVAIGVEQTCDSVKLNVYKFPDKCLLLLGNEKEGIPFQLLPYLDVCVEIPQFGVVRSLNVHVAGSTCIWEYIKQIVM